jgi:hypothetical protein
MPRSGPAWVSAEGAREEEVFSPHTRVVVEGGKRGNLIGIIARTGHSSLSDTYYSLAACQVYALYEVVL